uniref:tetratricopeptide repeat protein n=1 Tax=Nakamurella sp. TaxID=1869182 RepID=UPI0037850D0C
LRDTYGDTPQTLRDLSIALDNVGGTARDRGDLTAATTAYTESLDIARRLRDTYGDTPQTLRDLSIALDNVGGTARDRGDLTAATTAYRDALATLADLATYGPNWADPDWIAAIEASLAAATEPLAPEGSG